MKKRAGIPPQSSLSPRKRKLVVHSVDISSLEMIQQARLHSSNNTLFTHPKVCCAGWLFLHSTVIWYDCALHSADDEATSGPSSPTMQHVLDTFLDDAFPGKLADIINQCVSRYIMLKLYPLVIMHLLFCTCTHACSQQ